jgi:hypothetical protein
VAIRSRVCYVNRDLALAERLWTLTAPVKINHVAFPALAFKGARSLGGVMELYILRFLFRIRGIRSAIPKVTQVTRVLRM